MTTPKIRMRAAELWQIACAVAIFVAGLAAPAKSEASTSRNAVPTVAQVKAICLNPSNDLRLDAYVYYKDYLFCNTSDDNTGGQQLYKRDHRGTYKFIRGGGGEYRAQDLSALAKVPNPIAQHLVKSMDSQLRAVQNGTQLRP